MTPAASAAGFAFLTREGFSGILKAMDEEQDVQFEAENNESPKGGDAAKAVKKLKDEIANLKMEKQEYLDGWQRAKADYVNALKRFEREMADALALGQISAVEALLPALDALERARSHGGVSEGFEAIAKQLEAGFAALDLEPIGLVGERFNPALHEALGQDRVEEKGKDHTITVVLERGWKTNDRIIRPAKVHVAHFEEIN